MTKTELKKMSCTKLRRIAYDMNILVPGDYTRQDILEAILDVLGDCAEAWATMEQYRWL